MILSVGNCFRATSNAQICIRVSLSVVSCGSIDIMSWLDLSVNVRREGKERRRCSVWLLNENGCQAAMLACFTTMLLFL